jgi:amidohydrolase
MNERILASLREEAQQLKAETIARRRYLHAHPELSFEEYGTAEYVATTLRELGIPFEQGVAQTGVVGLIEGLAGDGPTLALRADMDALPILEANEVEYCSTVPGKMHACGHDAHTASLLTAAKLLHRHREHLKGRVKLIFQPSEEKLPGGASVMMQEGVLESPHVSGIVGQHVMPLLPVGKIGVRSGMYMASADEIYLTIRGKGGHGAQPHTTVDSISIMAQVVSTLQQVISRKADPRIPSVLTFGKVIAEGATNIIPEKVYLEGTFRTFNEAWRDQAHQHIRQIVVGLVESMGGRAELDIRRGYPVLYNEEKLTERVRSQIEAYMGAENVVDLDLWMASEDFAYYTQAVPGCFYRLGTRNEERGIVHALHHPRFDIDEDALGIGPGLQAWLALSLQAQA